MSPPISRPYYISLEDPIIISYPVTPHKDILFRIITPHSSSAYHISVHFAAPPVVVKRQAEEGEKRAPHKLRTQRNLKLKTRARLNKRARKQERNKALESNL